MFLMPLMNKILLLLRKAISAARLALSRVETRGPLVALLPLALLAPLVVAGPIRCTTGLSLPVAFALACLAGASLSWVCRVWSCGRDLRVGRARQLMIEASALLLSCFAVWALYNRDFGGFPNLDGWDGGTHVFIKDQFAGAFPDIYNGQVAYYGFAWLIEKILHVDSFRSFTIAFYVSVVGTVALPLVITFAVLADCARARLAAFGVATALVTLAGLGVLLVVVLPLTHYNQAAGYYVQVFGLLPLLGLWIVDAQVRTPWLRLGGLLVATALVRYTYALNLADVSLAVALVVVVDQARGWRRIAQTALGLGLAGAALFIATQIAPIFRIWGGMQGYSTGDLLEADLLLLAGLVLYLASQGLGGRWRSLAASPLARALRFPACFTVANAAFFTHLVHGKGVQHYYTWKYQMWASTVLVLTLLVVLAHLAASAWEKGALRSLRLWLGLATIAATVAVVAPVFIKTFAGYRTTLLERMRPHGPPYKFLRPLADVEGIARIDAILAAKHERFGGYLTAFFPMFSFMNGTLGRHAGIQVFFPPAQEPGSCVFWVSRERDIYRLGPAHQLDRLRDTVAAAGATCAEYPVPWKTTPQSLCYHCY